MDTGSTHTTHLCYINEQQIPKICQNINISGILRNFVQGGGFNKFSSGQREWGSGGIGPLVSGYGGSCNLLQEISLHIVKFS